MNLSLIHVRSQFSLKWQSCAWGDKDSREIFTKRCIFQLVRLNVAVNWATWSARSTAIDVQHSKQLYNSIYIVYQGQQSDDVAPSTVLLHVNSRIQQLLKEALLLGDVCTKGIRLYIKRALMCCIYTGAGSLIKASINTSKALFMSAAAARSYSEQTKLALVLLSIQRIAHFNGSYSNQSGNSEILQQHAAPVFSRMHANFSNACFSRRLREA